MMRYFYFYLTYVDYSSNFSVTDGNLETHYTQTQNAVKRAIYEHLGLDTIESPFASFAATLRSENALTPTTWPFNS